MRKRSTLVAFLLSVIPGLGQIYAGAPSRGIALLVGLPLQALLLWLVDLAPLNAWLVLVWLWITNLAILFGHELNAERERDAELREGTPGAERKIQLEPRTRPGRRRTA